MRLVVARIGRARGLDGEVTVEVRTDAPAERFVPGGQLHVSDGARRQELAAAGRPTTLTLVSARDHNGTQLLRFAEVGDRTAAEAMRDAVLECDVPDDVDEPDAWYDHQLVGLAVHDPWGAVLGRVIAVQHLPAQDLLVVRPPAGGERLVPFVKALVPEVDLEAGRVVVRAPTGLLDDAAGAAADGTPTAQGTSPTEGTGKV